MRFTLDTNCLIDAEEGRPNASFIRDLVSRHGKNGITVAISSIGASERQRAAGYAQSFSEFQAKLKAIGFEGLEHIPPLAYWNICFFDPCIMADENDTLERDIHNVLFPNIEFMWVDYAKAHGLAADSLDKIWRNAKCDVLTVWCHIKHGGGVFVTSDSNFHATAKLEKLKALGVGTIAYLKMHYGCPTIYEEDGATIAVAQTGGQRGRRRKKHRRRTLWGTLRIFLTVRTKLATFFSSLQRGIVFNG